jgi:hypothetical protein
MQVKGRTNILTRGAVMNKQAQTKEQPNQPDQPEYKDQPLPDTKSKKIHGAGSGAKEGKIVKSFKEMDIPLN